MTEEVKIRWHNTVETERDISDVISMLRLNVVDNYYRSGKWIRFYSLVNDDGCKVNMCLTRPIGEETDGEMVELMTQIIEEVGN